ncbi:MAG: transposase [Planctomycetes bacterium]|nr:transposase [Planctomycetota bacterium]
MNSQINAPQYTQFRQEVYQSFSKLEDASMDLIDALCSTPNARSVPELSLSSNYCREHTSIYKAIEKNEIKKVPLHSLAAALIPAPEKRSFWLFALDATPQRRQFARSLTDRGYIYYPNAVGGNKPISIGHEYSTIAVLPERSASLSRSWVIPVAVRRIRSDEDKELVGADQFNIILDDDKELWHAELVVKVGDSRYSKAEYLHAVHKSHPDLISVVKVRGNRKLYNFMAPPEENPPNRPKFKGEVFKLDDPRTQRPPDVRDEFQVEKKKGKIHKIVMEMWKPMAMPGKNKPERIPMEKYPFLLVKNTVFDKDETEVYPYPQWLIVVGERREELTLKDIYESYDSRSGLEHFFRFGKQKLLMGSYQTPDTPREENWWHMTHLAYLTLWAAHSLSEHHPRPWERHLPEHKKKIITPALVQRDFSRLISQFGTPAKSPKPRGKSPGRTKGTVLPRRERCPIIYKGQKRAPPIRI